MTGRMPPVGVERAVTRILVAAHDADVALRTLTVRPSDATVTVQVDPCADTDSTLQFADQLGLGSPVATRSSTAKWRSDADGYELVVHGPVDSAPHGTADTAAWVLRVADRAGVNVDAVSFRSGKIPTVVVDLHPHTHPDVAGQFVGQLGVNLELANDCVTTLIWEGAIIGGRRLIVSLLLDDVDGGEG